MYPKPFLVAYITFTVAQLQIATSLIFKKLPKVIGEHSSNLVTLLGMCF
jgi:hypothetical protein